MLSTDIYKITRSKTSTIAGPSPSLKDYMNWAFSCFEIVMRLRCFNGRTLIFEIHLSLSRSFDEYYAYLNAKHFQLNFSIIIAIFHGPFRQDIDSQN